MNYAPNTTQDLKTYRLLGGRVGGTLTNAPRLFKALQSLAKTNHPRAIAMMCDAWDCPAWVAEGLLTGEIPSRIEGEAVAYDLPSAAIIPLHPSNSKN